jgi:hypothetical protein
MLRFAACQRLVRLGCCCALEPRQARTYASNAWKLCPYSPQPLTLHPESVPQALFLQPISSLECPPTAGPRWGASLQAPPELLCPTHTPSSAPQQQALVGGQVFRLLLNCSVPHTLPILSVNALWKAIPIIECCIHRRTLVPWQAFGIRVWPFGASAGHKTLLHKTLLKVWRARGGPVRDPPDLVQPRLQNPFAAQ